MADVTLVQGDTRPSLEAVLKLRRTDGPLVLTTASAVKFQMRQVDDRAYTVNRAAVVVDAATGSVRYDWQTNDLSIYGEYVCQWEITWSDGTKQTVPESAPNTLTVRRQ